MFDFSPIVALAVISVAGSVVQQISAWGRVSIGLVLALLVQAVWSAMSFLLLFVLAALVIRFVGYLIRANVHSVFWRVIDSICNSVLYRLNSIIFRRRAVNYMASLLIGIAVCAGAYFVIDYLVGLLMAALIQPAFFFG
jgi:YggT family protein